MTVGIPFACAFAGEDGGGIEEEEGGTEVVGRGDAADERDAMLTDDEAAEVVEVVAGEVEEVEEAGPGTEGTRAVTIEGRGDADGEGGDMVVQEGWRVARIDGVGMAMMEDATVGIALVDFGFALSFLVAWSIEASAPMAAPALSLRLLI